LHGFIVLTILHGFIVSNAALLLLDAVAAVVAAMWTSRFEATIMEVC